jgi:hypothetical protein
MHLIHSHASSNAKLWNRFEVSFPIGQDKLPSSDQQRAGNRIGIGPLKTAAQVRRQPGNNCFRQPTYQGKPVNPPRQEHIEQIANGISCTFDDATADRITLIGVA